MIVFLVSEMYRSMLVFKFLWYKEKKDFNYRRQWDVVTERNGCACFLWEWSQNDARSSSHLSPWWPCDLISLVNICSWGFSARQLYSACCLWFSCWDLWPICDILRILAIRIEITYMYFLGDKITSRFSVMWPFQQNKLIIIIVTKQELMFCCLVSDVDLIGMIIKLAIQAGKMVLLLTQDYPLCPLRKYFFSI